MASAHIIFNALAYDYRKIWDFAKAQGLNIAGSTKHGFSAVALAHVHGPAKAIAALRAEIRRRGAHLSLSHGTRLHPWPPESASCATCNAYYAAQLARKGRK